MKHGIASKNAVEIHSLHSSF